MMKAGAAADIIGAGTQAYLSWSMCWSASYMQKGLSMVVHSFMNSMEPPVSAEMSQMASSLQRPTRLTQTHWEHWSSIKMCLCLKASHSDTSWWNYDHVASLTS